MRKNILGIVLSQYYIKHIQETPTRYSSSTVCLQTTLLTLPRVIGEYKARPARFLRSSFCGTRADLASGWNLGIRSAQGEYVVRIDAHATVASDFLEKSVETILDVRDVVCVGGPLNTASRTKQGELVRAVLTSPFGVGGARFRYQKTPGYVDTVAYGLYRKDIFEQVGYLDESLERTQDNDLHRRIRAAGGRFS